MELGRYLYEGMANGGGDSYSFPFDAPPSCLPLKSTDATVVLQRGKGKRKLERSIAIYIYVYR